MTCIIVALLNTGILRWFNHVVIPQILAIYTSSFKTSQYVQGYYHTRKVQFLSWCCVLIIILCSVLLWCIIMANPQASHCGCMHAMNIVKRKWCMLEVGASFQPAWLQSQILILHWWPQEAKAKSIPTRISWIACISALKRRSILLPIKMSNIIQVSCICTGWF